MINHAAYFDSLCAVRWLQPVLGEVVTAEIHLMNYLACLLSLYEGHPVGDWGYQFVATKDGAPFSPDVQQAIDSMTTTGALAGDSRGLACARLGDEQYAALGRVTSYQVRERYVRGACASTLALPIGLVRSAIGAEPELRSATRAQSTRKLLDGPGLGLLYEHFQVLQSALPDRPTDPMVPAVVWLTYLVKAVRDDAWDGAASVEQATG